MRRPFPVLRSYRYTGEKEYVPWEFLESHENQAYENHGQSFEQLARRGGLSWTEIYYIIKDREFDERNAQKYSDDDYKFAVLDIMRKFYLEN